MPRPVVRSPLGLPLGGPGLLPGPPALPGCWPEAYIIQYCGSFSNVRTLLDTYTSGSWGGWRPPLALDPEPEAPYFAAFALREHCHLAYIRLTHMQRLLVWKPAPLRSHSGQQQASERESLHEPPERILATATKICTKGYFPPGHPGASTANPCVSPTHCCTCPAATPVPVQNTRCSGLG